MGIARQFRLNPRAAVAGRREGGRALHETGEPSKMLAVKPAEHQDRSQQAGRQTAFDNDLFLRLLGFSIKIARSRIDHRRTDMHDLADVVAPGRVEDVSRGRDTLSMNGFSSRPPICA
jgi:hypothetical protein